MTGYSILTVVVLVVAAALVVHLGTGRVESVPDPDHGYDDSAV